MRKHFGIIENAMTPILSQKENNCTPLRVFPLQKIKKQTWTAKCKFASSKIQPCQTVAKFFALNSLMSVAATPVHSCGFMPMYGGNSVWRIPRRNPGVCAVWWFCFCTCRSAEHLWCSQYDAYPRPAYRSISVLPTKPMSAARVRLWHLKGWQG